MRRQSEAHCMPVKHSVILKDTMSINQYHYMLNVLGQLGPNRQEVQFSEVIQTRFASYMPSIPKGTHHMHLVHTEVIESAITHAM